MDVCFSSTGMGINDQPGITMGMNHQSGIGIGMNLPSGIGIGGKLGWRWVFSSNIVLTLNQLDHGWIQLCIFFESKILIGK